MRAARVEIITASAMQDRHVGQPGQPTAERAALKTSLLLQKRDIPSVTGVGPVGYEMLMIMDLFCL